MQHIWKYALAVVFAVVMTVGGKAEPTEFLVVPALTGEPEIYDPTAILDPPPSFITKYLVIGGGGGNQGLWRVSDGRAIQSSTTGTGRILGLWCAHVAKVGRI